MNRKELAALISEKHDLPKVGATRILDTVLETLADELKKGNPVAIAGFGTFKVASRAARTGRNPSTGEKVKIAERKLVKFSAATALADVVDPKFAKARATKAAKAAAKKAAAEEVQAPVKATAKKSAAAPKTAAKKAAPATSAAAAPAKKAAAKTAAKTAVKSAAKTATKTAEKAAAPAKKAAAKKKAA